MKKNHLGNAATVVLCVAIFAIPFIAPAIATDQEPTAPTPTSTMPAVVQIYPGSGTLNNETYLTNANSGGALK